MKGQLAFDFDAAERAEEQPYEARPESMHSDYPRFAIYQGEMHRILYYEGDGMFRLLDKRDYQKSAHRSRFSFPRPKKKA